MYLEVAVSSSIGKRKNNEDNYFVMDRIRPDDDLSPVISLRADCFDLPGVFAVCDGMGGLSMGEVASHAAMDVLKSCVGASMVKAERVIGRMHRAVCDEAVKRRAQLGAAVAVVRVSAAGEAEVCNVGDCRVFLLLDGKLTQVSVDHTTEQELKDIGIASTDAGGLTQYLGMEEDEYELDPYITRVLFPPRAKMLLCSDGVRQRWSTAEIAEILRQSGKPGVAADCLTKETAPGQDNATAIVLSWTEG